MRKISVIIFSLIIGISSCDKRVRMYLREQKKLANNEITEAQYDSLINTFFTINKSSFQLHPRVKLDGTYIREENCYEYETCKVRFMTLKLTDSCITFRSSWIYDILSNKIVSETYGDMDRYTNKNGEIVVEYLLSKDFSLYNIYKYGEISENGDTITFYRTVNINKRGEKKRPERKEVYIYNPNITAIPNYSG